MLNDEVFMKKTVARILSFIMLFAASGCAPRETTLDIDPDISRMKNICELATLECYYHNVAKFYEEDASGHLFWKKDKHFWIEYSGIVKIGIDVSEIGIDVNDKDIKITLPPARVMGCKLDETSLTKESFIVAKDSADITAEDEQKVIAEAQDAMEASAEKDEAMLANAQQTAKNLLEKYIKNIEELTGKKYTISWVYLDESGSVVRQPVNSSDTVTSE